MVIPTNLIQLRDNSSIPVKKSRQALDLYATTMQPYEKAANYLGSKVSFRPEIGIICGSGLSNLSKQLSNSHTIYYEDIPGFPKATVSGHTGELVFGLIGDIECVCMRGRFHYYEGNPMSTVALPVWTMRLLGVKLLIVTNAAGGLNKDYLVGDVMVIQDHFGLPTISGVHPLIGPNDDKMGARFVATSDAFDEYLQDIVLTIGDKLGYSKYMRPNGTYCFVSGPTYESKAESRFLRSIGGDSVGMSTIPEVLAAKHCGMKILGLSLITNKVVVSKDEIVHASHAEVLAAVEQSGKKVECIVKEFVLHPDVKKFLSTLQAPIYEPTIGADTNEKSNLLNNDRDVRGTSLAYLSRSIIHPFPWMVATAALATFIIIHRLK